MLTLKKLTHYNIGSFYKEILSMRFFFCLPGITLIREYIHDAMNFQFFFLPKKYHANKNDKGSGHPERTNNPYALKIRRILVAKNRFPGIDSISYCLNECKVYRPKARCILNYSKPSHKIKHH